MLKKERQALILQQLNVHNRVTSIDLLRRLNVSEDTVRRDLQELAEEGKLIKVHGGALSKSFHFTLSANDVYQAKQKKTIAEKAAALLLDGMVVLITGGTTVRELVQNLKPELKATFITPSIPIALELMNHNNSEVFFIGSQLNKVAQMAVGGGVVTQLHNTRADLCLMGVNAISAGFGISESTLEVAEVKKAMREASSSLVAMAISEKLGTDQPFRVCRLQPGDTLITEQLPHHEALLPYTSAGVSVL